MKYEIQLPKLFPVHINLPFHKGIAITWHKFVQCKKFWFSITLFILKIGYIFGGRKINRLTVKSPQLSLP